jgi:Protein of unknown function (DUF4236)/Bacterial SH3 domain
MGWGFRRSFSIGGMRLYASKSGLSASVGVKGLRLNVGPRGAFISAGAGGFYYRARLGGKRPVAYHAPPPSGQSFEPRRGAANLFQIDADESFQSQKTSGTMLLDTLNNLSTPRPVFWIGLIMALGAMVSTVMLISEPALILLCILLTTLAFAFVVYHDHRSRRFVLAYDLDTPASKRYDVLVDAYHKLQQAGSVRGIDEENRHGDWKRNAGATSSVSQYRVSCNGRGMPRVLTNLENISVDAKSRTLFFLPDQLLIRRGFRYSAIPYAELAVEMSSGQFVWDDWVPGDAEVVNHTWRFVRRDGGPDHRFNNNRQIPVVRVYYLHLASPSGLRMRIQSTSRAAVEAFASALHGLRGAHEAIPAQERGASDSFREALSIFGLQAVPDAAGLRSAYRELALRNHPDRFANSNQAIQLMALQRMQEINVAYQTLMSSIASSSNEVVTQDEMVDKVTLRYLADRVRYAIAAAVLCALAIVGSVSILINRDAINHGFGRGPVRGAVETIGVAEPPSNEMARPTLASEKVAVTSARDMQEHKLSTIKADCRVRATPNLQAATVGRVAKGSEHHVLEERGGWRRVQVEGREGWVSNVCWTE